MEPTCPRCGQLRKHDDAESQICDHEIFSPHSGWDLVTQVGRRIESKFPWVKRAGPRIRAGGTQSASIIDQYSTLVSESRAKSTWRFLAPDRTWEGLADALELVDLSRLDEQARAHEEENGRRTAKARAKREEQQRKQEEEDRRARERVERQTIRKQGESARHQRLIAEGQQRVGRNPQDATLQLELGHIFLVAGQFDKAGAQYEIAMALGVSELKTAGLLHLLYAYALHPGSRPKRVLSVTGVSTGRYSSIRYVPKTVVRWGNELARFHLERAIRSFESAIKSDPRDLDVLRILCDIYDSLSNRPKQKGRIESLIVEAETLRKLSKSSTRPVPRTTVAQGADFEGRCLRLLADMGYTVEDTGQSGDGGIDMRARDSSPISGGTLIVQCKDWQTPVGEPTVRDLYGLVLSEGANKGVVITTAQFTVAARRFVLGKPLELIDGDVLAELERRYVGRS